MPNVSSKDKLLPVILKIANKQYKLEYSRASVQAAESMGLRIDEIVSKPATNLPILFYTAFLMNHPETTRTESDKIIDKIGGIPTELIAKLLNLYNEPINSLIGTAKGIEKNGQYCLEVT